MKVVIVSKRYGYMGRRERIEYIVSRFRRYGDFEFIAFDLERPVFSLDGVHILRVNPYDGISKCISYLRCIIGNERFFAVFEDAMEGTDIGGLVDYHRKNNLGITVAARKRDEYRWKSCGIMLIENEYLDLICDGWELEPDIVVKCAEDGELGVFQN